MKRIPVLMSSIAAATMIASVSGCSVVPKSFTPQEYDTIIQHDKKTIAGMQEPISGDVSLEEAIARSLKYNLENRLSVMEAAIRNRQLDLSTYDMLPKVVAGAGYSARNKEDLSVSQNTVTGIISDQPSESSDKERETADLGLSWNVLDFGVSYYQAQQQGDMLLIAEQNRRKMANQIVQKVRDAYWRAAATQPILKQVQPLLVQAKEALADSQKALKERLAPPLESLQYQKTLLGVIRDLELIEHEATKAKFELSSLMGVIPTDAFNVIVSKELVLPRLDASPEAMVDQAFMLRPEIQQEAYQHRITSLEAKKALLKAFPSLTFSGSMEYDSNSYKINNSWAEAGIRVSWNLMNLFTGPKAVEMAEAQEALAVLRRQAAGMSVMTQVYVGYQEYLRAVKVFEKSQMLSDIEREIFGHIKNATEQKTQTRLESIRAELSSIYAELGRYKAYSDVQNALGNLNLSIGLDPLPKIAPSHDLKPLVEAIGVTLKENSVAKEEQKSLVLEKEAPKVAPVAMMKESPKPKSVENTLDSEVKTFVNQWADAWSSQDSKAYTNAYSKRVLSQKNVAQEIKKRTTHGILVTVIPSNIQISQNNEEIQVTFEQTYVSVRTNTTVKKSFTLEREEGILKIISESGLEFEPKSLKEKPSIQVLKEESSTVATQVKKTADTVATPAVISEVTNKKSLDIEVKTFVNQWADAWSSKDTDSYAKAYSTRFISPKGLAYDAWIKERQERIKNNLFITVIPSHVKITMENETIFVSFEQTYVSAKVNETVQKSLILVREDGMLKILSEKVE